MKGKDYLYLTYVTCATAIGYTVCQIIIDNSLNYFLMYLIRNIFIFLLGGILNVILIALYNTLIGEKLALLKYIFIPFISFECAYYIIEKKFALFGLLNNYIPKNVISINKYHYFFYSFSTFSTCVIIYILLFRIKKK